jgi:DNA-binding SARP family transcriptional activator
MIPTLHIHLLGDFLLVSDDHPVTAVHTPRLQSVIAYLVLHRTAPQTRAHLAFLLWPDLTEAQAHANLRKALYHLRQALPSLDQFLHVERQYLHWQPSRQDASWTLDVQELEQGLVQAKQAEQARDMSLMRQALERAVDLYRGDLLPSCYDEWILPERERVRLQFLQAAEQLIELLEQERAYSAAITVAQRLLRQDPLRETTYRQLMRFYALRGDRVAALRVYHTCVTLLERELAAEPSEATRQAYASLLQMDTPSPPQSIALSSRSAATPLVGRKREWGQLQEAWQRGAGGHPHLVILSGEAGIGKTKLAEELVAWVSRLGMATASARCYAAEGRFAYAPLMTWLRADAVQTGLSVLADTWLTEVARLVPEWLTKRPHLSRPTPLADGWQRQHLFEALARAFIRTPNEAGVSRKASSQPLLLLLDDLHWCDNETLEWVHYLLRFEPQARLLLVGTVRAEETGPGHPLVSFLGTLQRDGLLSEMALGPLSPAETTSLAEHVAGRQLDPARASDLYSETEGNPLFVVEMVRARSVEQSLTEQGVMGTPRPLLPHHVSTLPPTVQTVLAARLAQLSPSAHELANLAAVIGRAFSLDVLARASDEREGALVRDLDELWQRRIVREQGGDAYDFSHDKLREQAYTSLSTVHRRLLHRRVAEALEAVYADTSNVVSLQVAVHYERAGLLGKASVWYQRAGEVASRMTANAQAIDAYQQAAALLEASAGAPAPQDWQWERAAQVYTHLGDLLGMTGCTQEARQAYQQGRRHIPAQAFLWQAHVQRKIAKTWNHPSTLETLLHGYKEAERILEQAPDRSSLQWHQEWLDIQLDQLLPLQLHRISVQEMSEMLEKIQPIVDQYGTVAQQAQFFLSAAARNLARDRPEVSEETIAQFRSALSAVQQTENTSLVGFARFGLGRTLFLSGHLDEAEEQMRAAMNVGEEMGHAFLLERCLSFLPFIFRQRGQVEEVRRVITRALTVPGMKLTSLLLAHRAWLARRDGEMDKAEEYSRAALEEWQHQRQVNPHQWAALWPLIGVLLVQQRLSEAMHYGRMLLDVRQQPSSEQLGVLLESAWQAWNAGQQARAYAHLQQVLPLAEEMGYL